MNRGHARRETEETGWEDALARFPSLGVPVGTPSAVPVSSTRRARSAAETVRGTADPFADTEAAFPGGSAAHRRDWCVDRGDELLPMSTFELWAAIERADVAPWMRVWREGMECWTAAGELIELSWAAAGTPQPSSEAESTTGPHPAPPEPPSPCSRDVLRVPDLAPVPEPVSPPSHAPPPSHEPPRGEAPTRVQPRAARWVAVGSLVAAAAIGAAFFVAAGGSVEIPVDATSVAEPSPHVPAAAPSALAPSVAAAPPRPAEPAKREERGQHRLPRGGGHVYGR